MRISDWSSDVCSSDLPQVSEPVEPQLSLRPFPAALIITKCRDPHAVKIDFSHDLCVSEQEHALHLGSTARESTAAGVSNRGIVATQVAADSRPDTIYIVQSVKATPQIPTTTTKQ